MKHPRTPLRRLLALLVVAVALAAVGAGWTWDDAAGWTWDDPTGWTWDEGSPPAEHP
jgi:hypothetical protein